MLNRLASLVLVASMAFPGLASALPQKVTAQNAAKIIKGELARDHGLAAELKKLGKGANKKPYTWAHSTLGGKKGASKRPFTATTGKNFIGNTAATVHGTINGFGTYSATVTHGDLIRNK